jgi:hypothetical protein
MTTPPGQAKLADGFHDVTRGMIATIVTHLGMTMPPRRAAALQRPGWAMRHEPALALAAAPHVPLSPAA